MEKLCHELECISWSYKSFTANELNAKKCFPILVKISSSGLGNRFYEDYSTGQILYLHSVKRQFRFLAYDTKGNEISVPSTFLSENGGILKSHNVLLGKDLELPNEQNNSYTIKKEGWMRYLMGTCISEDGIISKKIECIPVKCKNIYFKVALNIGASSEDRLAQFEKDLYALVETIIPNIQFNSYLGNPEIIINAQPNLIDIEEESTLPTSPQSFKVGHRYEYISQKSPMNPHYIELTTEKPYHLKSTGKKGQCHESEKRSITDISKDYLEPTEFRKDQYHAQGTNKQHKNTASLHSQPELMKSAQESRIQSYSVRKDVDSSIPIQNVRYQRDLPPIPTSPDRDLPPIPKSADRDLPPIPKSANKDLPPIPKSGDRDLPSIPKSADRNLPPIPTSAHRDLQSSVHLSIPSTEGKEFHYEVVNINMPHQKSKTGPICSKDDLPDKLEMLSVEQVGNCLELLHLNKYVEKFKENSIDGGILCDLTKNILIDDFGFKNVEALKLKKFINEKWLPIL